MMSTVVAYRGEVENVNSIVAPVVLGGTGWYSGNKPVVTKLLTIYSINCAVPLSAWVFVFLQTKGNTVL